MDAEDIRERCQRLQHAHEDAMSELMQADVELRIARVFVLEATAKGASEWKHAFAEALCARRAAYVDAMDALTAANKALAEVDDVLLALSEHGADLH